MENIFSAKRTGCALLREWQQEVKGALLAGPRCSDAARCPWHHIAIIFIMTEDEEYFAVWATFCLAFSGLLGSVAAACMKLYLYEELTRMGDFRDLTLEQVHWGAIEAAGWCGLAMLVVAVAQFFVSRDICIHLKCSKPKLKSSVLAVLSWFILFLPATVQTYRFYIKTL